MKFQINLNGKTLYNTMRQAGYAPGFSRSSSKLVFVRPLAGSDFPRFHIYATASNNIASVNLHIDQKKPSYKGTHAHGGEYDGSMIEDEVSRIKQLSAS